MGQTKHNEENTENPIRSVLVWDLPTRLFHWLLVIFVIVSFVTGNIGGNAMQYHEWGGFAILALLLFRLVWGFVGSRESRFATFFTVRLPLLAMRGHSCAVIQRNTSAITRWVVGRSLPCCSHFWSRLQPVCSPTTTFSLKARFLIGSTKPPATGLQRFTS